MDEKNVNEFKRACEECLKGFTLNDLRNYARYLQLEKPTTQKKKPLIADIIAVICGELVPERNKKGKPPKNDYINPKIPLKLKDLQEKYATGNTVNVPEEAVNKNCPKNNNVLPLLMNPSFPSAPFHCQLVINFSSLSEQQKEVLNLLLNSL